MNLFHQETGHGDPMLLLHGFTGSSADWMPLTPMLPGSHRLIVPDLRGHGRSENLGTGYTHRQSALDVFELLGQLGVETLKACGVSGGAMTLLHMATQQPERIESMVLVSPTTHYPPQAREIMGSVDPDNQPDHEWQAMRQKHPRGDDQIRALWRQARAFKDDFDDMNFQPEDLSTIRARTLIIHGEADPLFPLEIAETLEQHIPDSSLWVVPQGGHVPVFGEHMDEFFERISAFFNAPARR